MKKLKFISLALLLLGTVLAVQGNPEFGVVPDDVVMTSEETVELQWILNNAEYMVYSIVVTVGNESIIADKGEVINNIVEYIVSSPPVGNISIVLTISSGGIAVLEDSVLITVVDNSGGDSTLETNVETSVFPVQLIAFAIFSIALLQQKTKKRK